jgi:elongation factor Ts
MLEDVKKLREQTGAGMLDCKKALEESNGDLEQAVVWLREKGIMKAAKKQERIAAEGLCDVLAQDDKAVIFEVNCETDFVSKNEKFRNNILEIRNYLLNSDVNTYEEALQGNMGNETLESYITAMTATIGEKISFRRFELVEKSDNETFGSYIHMGGKIGVLVVLNGANTEVAKDVAMHAAAMRPKYLNIESVPAEDVDHEREIQKQIAINEGKPENIAVKMVEGRIKKFYKEVCLTEQPFVKDDEKSVSEYVKANGGSIVSMVRYEVGEGLQKKNENFAEEVAKQMNG